MVRFDRQTWFAQQILVHERQLRTYLRRFLKARSDVADGIQETYARLLGLPDEALADIHHPHAFLFAAARNVALEWIRRERVIFRDTMAEIDAAHVLDQVPSAYEQLSARQELNLLASAIASLPERCRQVLTLRKLYGLPQKEIASRLRISENTVEKHTANGVRLCADYLYAFENDTACERLSKRGGRASPGSQPGHGRYAGKRMDRETRRARGVRRDVRPDGGAVEGEEQAARAVRALARVQREV